MDSTFISLCFGHLILMAIALPLVMQKIKPNHLYGVRTAFTLANETAWYQANRFWGISMIAAGPAFLLLSALFGNWQADADEQHVSITLFLVTVLLPAILTMGKLRAIKKM